jgi:hypothetical protein
MVLVPILELRGSKKTGPCYQKEGIESIIGRSGIGLRIEHFTATAFGPDPSVEATSLVLLECTVDDRLINGKFQKPAPFCIEYLVGRSMASL